MLDKLMKINSTQEEIIEAQAGIIDELFALVCQYANLENLEGIEPLLESIKDVARKEDLWR